MIYRDEPEEGVEARRDLEDGRSVDLVPLLLGQGQIALGRTGSMIYTHVWHYAQHWRARGAFLAWNPLAESEPQGWVRASSPETLQRGKYRRRPDGDATREYEAE